MCGGRRPAKGGLRVAFAWGAGRNSAVHTGKYVWPPRPSPTRKTKWDNDRPGSSATPKALLRWPVPRHVAPAGRREFPSERRNAFDPRAGDHARTSSDVLGGRARRAHRPRAPRPRTPSQGTRRAQAGPFSGSHLPVTREPSRGWVTCPSSVPLGRKTGVTIKYTAEGGHEG